MEKLCSVLEIFIFVWNHYCVKRVQIRSFFWSAVFGPEKTPYLDTFHAMHSINIKSCDVMMSFCTLSNINFWKYLLNPTPIGHQVLLTSQLSKFVDFIKNIKKYFFFQSEFSFINTDDFWDSREKEGIIFNPFYYFHPFKNIVSCWTR